MARRSDIRASDADREHVADRLRRATAEGRLVAHELEERLATALRARTYGELDAVVADLPGQRPARRESRELSHYVRPAIAVAVALPLIAVAVALVVAVMVFLVTGVFAVWMLWMAIGWWFFGRHGHHRGRGPRGRPPGGYGRPRRTAPRPGSWL
jgi:Domain of unknown function (DUF1707)